MPEQSQFAAGPRQLSAALRLSRTAERQWGVVSRRQVLACGLSSSSIRRWMRSGRLNRVYPGVYAVGHKVLCVEGRLAAALLWAGPGAALSHTTAVWWWRLLPREPREIHVSAPRRRSSVHGIHIHYRPGLERTSHRDLPITTVAQALLEVAPLVPFTELRRALAEADFRRLVDQRQLDAVLGRGRPGSAALRAALAAHQPRLARTLSVLEERFLGLCEEAELPLPEVNAVVHGLMVDALWRDERVIVELDGHAAHATPAAVERDRRRDLTLRAAGHTVLRYTWQQVTQTPRRVEADLRAALDLGGRTRGRRAS
jgi:predicted transcriptional regulator of viral defense system